MKYSLLIASLLFGIFFQAYAASPQEEARFLAELKTAIDKKDTKAFLNLYCWDRVPDFIKSACERTAPTVIPGVKVDSVTFVPASAETAHTEFVRDGVTYRPNLPVTKQAQVTYSHTGGKGKVTIPVGEKDGRLYITTAAPAK